MVPSFLRQWFSRASSRPDSVTPFPGNQAEPEAQFQRGVRLASGEGMAQDYARAAYWYALAAEQNHGLAQFNLAVMYGHGQGVARDETRSLMWMTRAAQSGDAAAQYTLGVQQHLAGREVRLAVAPEGRIEALKWVRLSAAQGYRGAEGACEFIALGMTREEVTVGERRAEAFVAGTNAAVLP
jgi:TPR repeat protein